MRPGMAPPIREAPGGVVLDVEVVPSAREDRFPAGGNPWRGTLRARVRAPPEEGQANEALRGLVAGFFGVPASRVRLLRGGRSRRKTLRVEGVSLDAATARLRREQP